MPVLRPLSRRRFAAVAIALGLGAGMPGCGDTNDTAPERPTWTEVEPILRGHCTHCHGSTAETAGNGYRFDFYDMNARECGDAATALGPSPVLARELAPQIAHAITTPDSNIRPSMPPLPAEYLEPHEWQTILRWVADPRRGASRPGNSPPTIRTNGTSTVADKTMDLAAIVEDRDGDPVVGVLMIGDEVHKMDRSGSFGGRLDTSAWPAGERTIRAVLCDGWTSVSSVVGTVQIKHP